ncbi:MAG: putative ornithine cyclodeaminase [Nocardioidaceae bacterium]|nr:putative ornithine cyclodeaminase [Nocardioidaceae bacterium]
MSEVLSVAAEQVRELVPMRDAVDAVRAAFLAMAAGEFEMPTRTVLGDGDFLVMAVRHRPSGTAMVKTLSLSFAGRQPAITGTVTWSDLASTDAIVADAASVTALRTGAVSGVATDLLAPPGAATCTVIGPGGQAADQVRAVHAVRPLRELTVVSRTLANADRLAATLAAELPGVAITTGTDPDTAVAGRDVVCCATPSTEPLFATTSLSATANVNAIGAYRPTMHELPGDLLAEALLVVDERDAVLEESGEVIDAVAAGLISTDALHELGDLLGHDMGGDVVRRDRTVFKSVGVAIQDWAVARLLAERLL